MFRPLRRHVRILSTPFNVRSCSTIIRNNLSFEMKKLEADIESKNVTQALKTFANIKVEMGEKMNEIDISKPDVDVCQEITDSIMMTNTINLVILLSNQKKKQTFIELAAGMLNELSSDPQKEMSWHKQSPVAFIFVIDACLHNHLIDEAIELYKKSRELGMLLDLPLLNDLVRKMVLHKNDAHRTLAIKLVMSLCKENGVSPNEMTYMPIVSELLKKKKFDKAGKLLRAVAKKKGSVLSEQVFVEIYSYYKKRTPDNLFSIFMEEEMNQYFESDDETSDEED